MHVAPLKILSWTKLLLGYHQEIKGRREWFSEEANSFCSGMMGCLTSSRKWSTIARKAAVPAEVLG